VNQQEVNPRPAMGAAAAASIHTLITFLGKGRDNPSTGYRQATYEFPDGRRTTAFFGLSLMEYLQPDRLVILGTSGSQWDLLVEHVIGGEEEAARRELVEAVLHASVTQELLERVTSLMTKTLGRPVTLRLIPYGKDLEEQKAILATIAAVVDKGAVSFDLTHGFRHLGMVGFLSAFMLERIRRLEVRSLWYGALDMTSNGLTPVLRLDGLRAIRRWIEALDGFEATGDYGVFSELLVSDGVPVETARRLQAAAFHERTFNLPAAVRKLRKFLPVLSQPLKGASGLFQEQLRKRLAWVEEQRLDECQRRLAYQYLRRGDFVRAAIFGWEALVTRECFERGLNPEDFRDARREAIEQLEAEIQEEVHPEWKRRAYWKLKRLRNNLAHGWTPLNGSQQRLLEDPALLTMELEACFKRLLG
jgi:CRISPR-associated Csx2 family protein